MFSTKTKRLIADAVQKILRATNDPELPQGEITFRLFVEGEDPSVSWADIRNNGAIPVFPDERQERESSPSRPWRTPHGHRSGSPTSRRRLPRRE